MMPVKITKAILFLLTIASCVAAYGSQRENKKKKKNLAVSVVTQRLLRDNQKKKCPICSQEYRIGGFGSHFAACRKKKQALPSQQKKQRARKKLYVKKLLSTNELLSKEGAREELYGEQLFSPDELLYKNDVPVSYGLDPDVSLPMQLVPYLGPVTLSNPLLDHSDVRTLGFIARDYKLDIKNRDEWFDEKGL